MISYFDNMEMLDELFTTSTPNNSEYGVDIHLSYVRSNEDLALGITMNDSDGLDVDVCVEGDDIYEMLNVALGEITEQMEAQEEEECGYEEDETLAEIQNLRADLGNIQARLDSLVNSLV